MANIFKPKRSNVASSIPTTSNLADGEMAVNSADKKIYLRDGENIEVIANYSTSSSDWISDQSIVYTTSNVGIGTTNPSSKLEVNGDVKVGIDTSFGLILTSPSGYNFRLIVDDYGRLSTVPLQESPSAPTSGDNTGMIGFLYID